jgi:hypothetical protein
VKRVLLVAALLLAVVDVAHAQETLAVSTDQAREHFEMGVQLIQQGRWNDAVVELDAARAIHATAPVLYNLGIALRGVGRMREAIERFEEFLAALPAGGSVARRAEVAAYVQELTAALGMLRWTVEPAGASIFVDGQRLPDGTSETQIDPGAHRVRAELAGYVTAEQEVQIDRGGSAQASLALEAVPTQGTLVVDSAVAGAQVSIDGVVMGSTPYEAHLDPGTHALVVSASGHHALERPIEIVVGESLRVQADLASEANWLESPILWTIVGVVVVGAAIGIGVGVASSGTQAPYQGQLGLATGLLEVRL